MRAIVNSIGNLEVHISSRDLCQRCRNMRACPLLQAILSEKVFLHYELMDVEECGLFKEI